MSNFSVDPADLHYSGHQCNTYRYDTEDAFDTAHTRMTGAVENGWVGTSAASMAAALDKLRDSGNALIQRLDRHSQEFTQSAQAYRRTEENNADSIGSAATGTSGLNLDTT